MQVHEGDAIGEGTLCDEGVGIEQQDVFSSRLPYANVVGFGEAEVLGVGDERDVGMERLKVFDGTVLAAIINHNHFGIDVCTGSFHRLEALMQEVLDIEIYNNDR